MSCWVPPSNVCSNGVHKLLAQHSFWLSANSSIIIPFPCQFRNIEISEKKSKFIFIFVHFFRILRLSLIHIFPQLKQTKKVRYLGRSCGIKNLTDQADHILSLIHIWEIQIRKERAVFQGLRLGVPLRGSSLADNKGDREGTAGRQRALPGRTGWAVSARLHSVGIEKGQWKYLLLQKRRKIKGIRVQSSLCPKVGNGNRMRQRIAEQRILCYNFRESLPKRESMSRSFPA